MFASDVIQKVKRKTRSSLPVRAVELQSIRDRLQKAEEEMQRCVKFHSEVEVQGRNVAEV